MKPTFPLTLLVASLLLSACAGITGSFDVDDVELNSASDTPKQPNTRDEESAPPPSAETVEAINQPAYGFSARIPVRNSHPMAQGPYTPVTQVDAMHAPLGDSTPFVKELEAQYHNEIVLWTHNPNGTASQKRTTQYVRSGYVLIDSSRPNFSNSIWHKGVDGYVYYLGKNPATAVPAETPTVQYKGTWDYTTDIDKPYNKNNYPDGRSIKEIEKAHGRQFNPALGAAPGVNSSATSYNETVYTNERPSNAPDDKVFENGHVSEFTVNFADKTMTGSLASYSAVNTTVWEQEKRLRYNIEAKLSGNRFVGRAIAPEGGHPYFPTADYLEGGFFGPNSEELGGKFVALSSKPAPESDTTGDSSEAPRYAIFGVFAAARQSSDNEARRTLYDATLLSEQGASSLDTFGNINTLLVDGRALDLLPVQGDGFSYYRNFGTEDKPLRTQLCCSNLDYAKFGIYEAANGQANLFLQGQRSAPEVISGLSGQASYKGTWLGRIDNQALPWSTEPGNGEGASRAEFTVDFDTKKLDGTLTAEKRTEPAFIIFADIQGNGFTGTASTHGNGINLDPGNTNNTHVVSVSKAVVSGGFYGDRGQEMGGTVHDTDHGVRAVFGTKRQVAND